MKGTFSDLDLCPEIIRAITEEGYTEPTEIQREAIPHIKRGVDLLGCAQTGTGKTAGFALPILNRLRGRPTGHLYSLVLTPTRELAVQVAESFRTYGRYLQLECGTVFGGVDMWHQVSMLKRGAAILVATPGRLLDHIHRGNLDFGTLEVVVLDEADRMLDMGFIDDVRSIIRCLPEQRQTLLFSATLGQEITKLAKDILRNPVSVRVSGPNVATAENIRQVAHFTSLDRKRELLRFLIDRHRMHQAIVFTRTKDTADKVAKYLEHTGLSVGALHSNKTQSVRLAILDGFRTGRIRVLVATDIAARGLDIVGVSHVINFDVPRTPEDYVHRIGRTARAGESGDAITLASRAEKSYMENIEWKLGIRIDVEDVRGYTLPGFGTPPRRESPPERAPERPRRGHRSDERPPQRDEPPPPRHHEPPTAREGSSRLRRPAPARAAPAPAHSGKGEPSPRGARQAPERGRGRTRKRFW